MVVWEQRAGHAGVSLRDKNTQSLRETPRALLHPRLRRDKPHNISVSNALAG